MTRNRMIVVGSVLCLLALAGTSAQAQTFSDPVTYTLVSENPGRAATGDLDGDGDRDIAVPTYVSGSPGYVEVLLNLGDGSFGAPTEYGVGNYPESVAAADLDGDGDLDLAVANRGDGTVSVLTNRGDGTFEAAVDHAAGSSPFVVVAGDLNGDGLADLAVANTYEVSWLANNGDGTFAAPGSYPIVDVIVGLDIGEMEGDGDTDLDLVVLHRGGNSSTLEAWVTVLWNDGSGNFGYSPRYSGGGWSDGWDYALHPSVDSLALGDLDGNGYLDVLIGATAGWRFLPWDGSPLGRVNVLENWGGGFLMSGQGRGSCPDDSPQLDTGDLDSDGDLDVVTGRVYFLNYGTGYFGGRQNHGGGGDYVTADDLDLDGLPDLVLPDGPDSVNVVLQLDLCPNDPNKADPGQCGCGQPDTDSDGDGVADCIDQCPGEPDVDSDGDGSMDCVDGCPDDPDKTDPGACGCGFADDDYDGDGVANCVDSCPRYDDTVDCNGNFIPDGCDVGGGWNVGSSSLYASGVADNHFFGQAVSVHDNVAVVSANGSGATHVYRNGGFEQTIPGPVSWGGWDVDVHGDVIAIGGGGPVRLFRYNAGAQEWQPEQELPSQGQYFGHSVSLHGDTLVVGSERDDDRGEDAGAAYVYRYSGGSWVEQGKLLASDGDAGDYFGTDVSIRGDVLVVGACNTLTSEHGAAYVFRLNGGDWVEEQKLTDPDTISNNDFGQAVAIAENVAVVSAPHDDEIGSDAGAAHTFRFDGNAWGEEQKLTATDGEPGDEFGRIGLSVDGNTLVVGAHLDDDRGQDAGSAYMFHFDEGAARWVEHWKLYATSYDAPFQDYFGRAVAVHGGNIVAGARWSDKYGTHSGAAFVYEFATFSPDCDVDGVPDECQPDTDLDGLIDVCDCDLVNPYCSTDCTDGDVDGFCVTTDCDDASPGMWRTPGEVIGLRFDLGTKDELSWDAPAEPGAGVPRYDTLRSEVAGDFDGAACVESDDASDRRAADLAVPNPGMAFHYLVRAENDCPEGQGPLGLDSSGLERTGNACP